MIVNHGVWFYTYSSGLFGNPNHVEAKPIVKSIPNELHILTNCPENQQKEIWINVFYHLLLWCEYYSTFFKKKCLEIAGFSF